MDDEEIRGWWRGFVVELEGSKKEMSILSMISSKRYKQKAPPRSMFLDRAYLEKLPSHELRPLPTSLPSPHLGNLRRF